MLFTWVYKIERKIYVKMTENSTISLWFLFIICTILKALKMICKWQTYGNIRTQSQGPKLSRVWQPATKIIEPKKGIINVVAIYI